VGRVERRTVKVHTQPLLGVHVEALVEPQQSLQAPVPGEPPIQPLAWADASVVGPEQPSQPLLVGDALALGQALLRCDDDDIAGLH
jgi:hypothetical protein